MDSILASHPAAPGLIHGVPDGNLFQNSVDVVEINQQQHCLALSGQCKKLDNVDRTKKKEVRGSRNQTQHSRLGVICANL